MLQTTRDTHTGKVEFTKRLDNRMAESKERYEFRKKLKELEQLRGQGTELVSVYVSPGSRMDDTTNKLRQEAGQAENIKSKQTRNNVGAALERLIHAIKNEKKPPENGVALFAGSINGKIEMFTIIPPEPLQMQTYRCDNVFFLEPLQEMLEAKELIGLMTVDRRECALAFVKGKRIDIVRVMGSQVPGKHRAGGQSAQRFERLIEIAAHEWFKKIGAQAKKLFEDPKVTGVIVGGPGPTKHSFMDGDYLSAVIKKKIIGIVDTSYTDEFGIREMMQKSGEILKEQEIMKEKVLLDTFMEQLAKNGLATYGKQEVAQALELGQIKTLLLSEDLDFNKIEELAEKAETTGAEIEMISTHSVEGQQFFQNFGGIGGLLRYKV